MPQKLRVQPSVGEAAADSLTVVWSGGLTADAMKDVSHFSLQWRTLTAGDLADERRAKLAALLADDSGWEDTAGSREVRAVRCVKRNLLPGTLYTFRIKAVGKDGSGEWGPPARRDPAQV